MLFKNTTKDDYFLKTRWGILRVGVSPNRLNHILFEECSQERIRADAHFHDAFMHWVRAFQNSAIDERWQLLSPQGTDFQKTVWRALLEIPSGRTVSYSDIARNIGRPKAWRAVGTAIAANSIALLIPCHRVVPASGGTGNYRWRADRKQALLEMENACNHDLTQLFKAA